MRIIDHYIKRKVPRNILLRSPLASVVLAQLSADSLMTLAIIHDKVNHYLDNHPGERRDLVGAIPFERVPAAIDLAMDTLVADGFVARIPSEILTDTARGLLAQ